MTDEQVEPVEHATEGAVEDLRIAAFWQAARGHVGMGKLDQVMGGSPEDVVPPPSWSYGNDAEAEDLLARVLDGRKTATALAVAELAQVGLEVPRVGDLSIVVDGAGDPRAAAHHGGGGRPVRPGDGGPRRGGGRGGRVPGVVAGAARGVLAARAG